MARNVGQGSVTDLSNDERCHVSLGLPMDQAVTGQAKFTDDSEVA